MSYKTLLQVACSASTYFASTNANFAFEGCTQISLTLRRTRSLTKERRILLQLVLLQLVLLLQTPTLLLQTPTLLFIMHASGVVS
jgi:hypothetical protein